MLPKNVVKNITVQNQSLSDVNNPLRNINSQACSTDFKNKQATKKKKLCCCLRTGNPDLFLVLHFPPQLQVEKQRMVFALYYTLP